ncbi:hypothetical protein PVA17_24440 [Lysinibacillus sp. CNPSo 3705]|uniref:hypothetical protein n=1 Tax=Lysinibacillus sp. CNPSo 3705 TaxID=3028148 RepID=UPI002363332B|nr:hypothetical protein [Lysinibacillus sp. CNPSo 3705]MDD1505867.1 hypothetical protein [Lysinibacillus sp. CNPSo 3705]
MPYGYEKYKLEKSDKSKNTLKFEVIVIKQFLSFVSLKYKKSKEPHEFTSEDVQDFLTKENESWTDHTIYRKQGHLKRFFDYLWETNQISYDFMEKFNYFSNKKEKSKFKFIQSEINYTYEKMLENKTKILTSDLADNSKLLTVLYMKGIQLIDMYNLTIDNFDTSQLDLIELTYTSKYNVETKIPFTDPLDIDVLRRAIEKAIFKGTDYLISVRSKTVQGEYVQTKPISSRTYINYINDFIEMPFRSDEIRVTYVQYLLEQGKSTSEISQLIGRTESSVIHLLQSAKERMSTLN